MVDIIGTSKWYPLQRGVRYAGVLPKFALFASSIRSKLLEYCAIDPKMCPGIGVGRRKRLKATYYRISCLYDNLAGTG